MPISRSDRDLPPPAVRAALLAAEAARLERVHPGNETAAWYARHLREMAEQMTPPIHIELARRRLRPSPDELRARHQMDRAVAQDRMGDSPAAYRAIVRRAQRGLRLVAE